MFFFVDNHSSSFNAILTRDDAGCPPKLLAASAEEHVFLLESIIAEAIMLVEKDGNGNGKKWDQKCTFLLSLCEKLTAPNEKNYRSSMCRCGNFLTNNSSWKCYTIASFGSIVKANQPSESRSTICKTKCDERLLF